MNATIAKTSSFSIECYLREKCPKSVTDLSVEIAPSWGMPNWPKRTWKNGFMIKYRFMTKNKLYGSAESVPSCYDKNSEVKILAIAADRIADQIIRTIKFHARK